MSEVPADGNCTTNGFTLLELLVVIVVMALVAGLSAGLIDLADDRGLKQAKAVLALAGSARSRARVHSTPVMLTISEEAVSLLASSPESGDRLAFPAGTRIKHLDNGLHKRTAGTVTFHPKGIAVPGVVVLQSGEEVYSVCIPSIGSGDIRKGELSLSDCSREQQ